MESNMGRRSFIWVLGIGGRVLGDGGGGYWGAVVRGMRKYERLHNK